MSQPEYDPTKYPPAPQYQPPHQQPYAGYPPGPPQQPYYPGFAQGQRLKETSLVFGLVGLFFLGFVFGPLAIINANKAEALGQQATAGKVLGWIDSVISGLGVLFVVVLFIFAGVMSASGMN